MPRYFCFNFIGKRNFVGGSVSVIDEICMESDKFPNNNTIKASIAEAFEGTTDITVTHKFEFKDVFDFRSYVGDVYVCGKVGDNKPGEHHDRT
jgi:hypothetical protein